MSQALTPAVGSKVGRHTLTAESPEAIAAPSFVGRGEDGQLARIFLVARAGTEADAVSRAAAQAKNLAHANTLRLLDAESVEGRLALSFEHVEGVSLLTLLTAAGAAGLPQKVALRIVLDVLEGLAAAHAGGAAHGELGPHLVWIGADGQARVMATGMAKLLGKALAPKTASDRLAYVAPERVKAAATGGAPVADAKCDVFSAAVLLWELVSKQRLFAGRLESAVIQKVLTAPVPPLASSVEDVPDELDEALAKAVERDPARRTATARELADALIAALPEGAGKHEDVAAQVADLAKKTLEELREKLTLAGATSATGELIVPPPRAPIPTLDELWVQSDDAPAAPKAPPRAPVAPKPAPKPIAKPSDLKPPTKPIDLKIAPPKPFAKPAETKAATPATAEAKPADAKVEEAVSATKQGDSASAAPAKEAKKPLPIPRKGTLLGMAPPVGAKVEAVAKPEPEAPKPAATPPAEEKAEAAQAEPVPASKTPPQGSLVKKADAADAAPPSAAPSSAAPPSVTPSGGEAPPPSLGKKPALAGNLKPGDTLGRYELLLPVAAGGMATVWAARLQGTAGFQKTVAIKTMLPGMSSDADFEEMFLDEARVAARIRHPNVVEIFDLGEEGETLYLVMEWVDGETFGALQKGSKAHGGVPLPILLRLASQACAGMHAAHELRDDKGALVDLVHRDVSPANILVSRTGFVKIVDFGVAKSKARMYTTRVGGMLKGKTPYLSPEQLAGQTIDRRSDLYSFGAVLYVMATGLHPFRGETEAKTIENIALRDPVPLRKIDPTINADFEAIVLKALAKDRADRYETASEMQRAIDTLAASIGQTVNDDDVAAFVRKVAGEGLEKRGAALREAISVADTGKQPVQPRAVALSEAKSEALEVAAAAAAIKADAEKVDIDDVDISDEPAAETKAKDDASSTASPASVPAIPPPPPTSISQDPLFNAPSLGSDTEPASAPVDTLAAASTEPADEEAPPQRKRTPMFVVGGILGVCLLIGGLAIARSGGDGSGSGRASPAVTSASNPDSARTGKPAEVPPAATPSATPAPAATEAPSASATTTATAEPAPTASAPEPVAAPEPTTPTGTKPLTGAKPVATTKPTTTAKPTPTTKPTTKPTTTKPIKKYEPQGI